MNWQVSLPTFSLQNPLPFIQGLFSTMLQAMNMIGATLTALSTNTINSVSLGLQTLYKAILTLNPLPLFIIIGHGFSTIGNAIAVAFSAIIYWMTLSVVFLINMIGSTVSTIGNALFSFSSAAVSTVINAFWVTTGFIGSMFVLLWQALATTVSYLLEVIGQSIVSIFNALVQAGIWTGNMIVSTVVAVANFIAILFQAVWNGFVMIIGTVISWFTYTMEAIGNAIAWPFKATSAYLMQYKPAVDVLGTHLSMGLTAMGDCFVSLNKTLASLSGK